MVPKWDRNFPYVLTVKCELFQTPANYVYNIRKHAGLAKITFFNFKKDLKYSKID